MIYGASELGSLEISGVRTSTTLTTSIDSFFDGTVKQVKMPTAVIFNVSITNQLSQTSIMPQQN